MSLCFFAQKQKVSALWEGPPFPWSGPREDTAGRCFLVEGAMRRWRRRERPCRPVQTRAHGGRLQETTPSAAPRVAAGLSFESRATEVILQKGLAVLAADLPLRVGRGRVPRTFADVWVVRWKSPRLGVSVFPLTSSVTRPCRLSRGPNGICRPNTSFHWGTSHS